LKAHKREVEAHFSRTAEGYDSWFKKTLGRYVDRHEREVVVSLLKPRAGELILDVGTGTGIYLKEAVGRGAAVVGLDISRGMLRVLYNKLRERGE
jgi:ubiquinone/menaquinone biosynthesis C-methylase UbiE